MTGGLCVGGGNVLAFDSVAASLRFGYGCSFLRRIWRFDSVRIHRNCGTVEETKVEKWEEGAALVFYARRFIGVSKIRLPKLSTPM